MARNIYALLVGIDQYPAPIPTLQGCVNDITAIEAYLSSRIDRQKYQLHNKKLLDQDATRQAIIDGFETHLCQAGSDDVVLFYYSGHGSQETASLELWNLERDGKLETLVCYDSRTSARDLASKELRCLIAKAAKQRPHIVIVLDCCHAGSGTREIDRQQKVRHTAADDRPRKLEEFLPDVALHLQNRGNGADLPEGKHVLLAACADREVASEYAGDGKTRGAFSYFLLDALHKASGTLSYRELFKEASSRVRSRIKDQTPRLEANDPDDLDNLPFLGGSEIFKPREAFFTLHHDGSAWMIDGGALHGLPKSSNIPIKLALYPQGSTSEQMRQLSGNVGEAEVIEVLPDKSIVTLTETPSNLTQDTVLKAIVMTLPPPTIGVYLEGDLKALAQVRQQLQTVGYGGKPSLYIREVEETTEAQYQLLARDGQYIITKPLSDRPLVAPLQGYDKAFRAVKNLEHIARWTTTIDLANPESQLPANAIKVQIHRDGKEVKDPHLRLEYEYKNNEWQAPTFQVQLTNTHNQPLFCAILDIAEDYSVSVPPFFPQSETAQTGCVRIEPGQEVWAAIYQGNRKISDKISAFFPDKFLEQDITEYQDVFKLIVSTVEFDANLLCQDNLLSTQVESGSTTRSLPSQLNSLNLLMAQIQSRQFGAPKLSSIDDWVTSQISITTVRPKNLVKLSSQVPTDLSPGVTIQPHSGLRASARLAAVPPSTRDVSGATLPPILDNYTQPFQFTASRGVAPGLSVLELQVNEDKTIEKVTPEDPLFLSVNQSLNENEYILPVAQDGEFWLPLGQGSRKDGKTEVRIERLPVSGEQPSSEKTRSLGGAIRIYFQKVVYHNLGHESPYPKLRAAQMAENGTVRYIEDEQQIKASVAKARRIVLYIHGIIGDTESMVPSVRNTKVKVNGQLKSLDQIYDLVLTFDYESLNTPIKELGKQLKDKLVTLGLQPNHGKKLHIVAHSMGGLVSRSMIEQWEGDRIVQHLIMLGTPNAGSPWVAVQDMATFALAAGLNGLSSVVFPAKVLGHLVALIEKIDINLDEMHPTKSPFLQELKDCADPGCPYSIIAGNTSLILQQAARINRLQAALKRSWQRAIDLPFMQEAHDIAVTVRSIVSVPVGRSPATYIQDQVACDHLSYFRHPAGLEALARAVVRAFSDPFNSSTSPQPPQPPTPTPGSSPKGSIVDKSSSRSLQNPAGNSTTQASLQSTVKTAVQATLQRQTNTPNNGKANNSSQAIKLLVEPNSDPSKPETGFANSYAVVVGINDYQSGIPPLRTAVNDAKAIAKILKREHGYTLISPSAQADQEQNEAWLDQDATLENLNTLLETLQRTIRSDDRLLFYFAGHGNYSIEEKAGLQGYLIPQDAENGKQDTYLSMNELRSSLLALECRHSLLILDCCYAGSFGFTSKRQFGVQQTIYKETLDWYKNKSAWQVITSTNHKQGANDGHVQFDPNDGLASKDRSHSPFASAFIAALKTTASDFFPADGVVTADELWMYLSKCVESKTRDQVTATNDKYLQTPGLYTFDEKHEGVQYFFFTSDFSEENLDDAPEVDEKNNPYRGGEPYTEEHSDKFFGRQEVIYELCNLVCDRPFTILLGESGSGKTSLIQAGLIPHLKRLPQQEKSQATTTPLQGTNPYYHKNEQWQILPVMQPGNTPVKNLENILNRICKERSNDAKVLLVIDQVEQLVQCRREEQDKFWQRLLKGLNEHSNQLRLLLSMRSDFEAQLHSRFTAQLKQQARQELDWRQARYNLRAMNEEDIREVIEGSASEVAVRFETETRNKVTLTKRLINEVKGSMPGALPWLSTALRKLYDKIAQRFRDAAAGTGELPDREIKWQDYDNLCNGKDQLIPTLILTRADEVYKSFLHEYKDEKEAIERIICNLMLRMLAVKEDGSIISRRMVKSEWEYASSDESDRANQVIDCFVTERLLIKGTAPISNLSLEAYVRPAHEALVGDWSRIQLWMNEFPVIYRPKSIWQKVTTLGTSRERVAWLPLWRDLTDEARRWNVEQRQNILLWNERPYLTQLKKISESNKEWFSKLETEFVRASLDRRKRIKTRYRRIGYTGLGLIAAVLLFGRNAEINQIKTERESAEKNLSLDQDMDALLDAIHAGEKLKTSFLLQGIFQPDSMLQKQIINTLQKAFYQIRDTNRLEVDKGRINHVAFSPNGQYIATVQLDGEVRLWEQSGKPLPNFKPFDTTEGRQFLESIKFSLDSQHLVTLITDENDEQSRNIASQWNFEGEKKPLSLPILNQRTVDSEEPYVLSSDGKVIVSVSKSPDEDSSSSDDIITFKDANSGEELGRIQQKLLLPGWRARLIVDYSSDSQLAATVSQYRDKNDFITLWNLQGDQLAHFPANQGGIESIRFSPDGKQLASIGNDGTVRLWQNLQGKSVAELQADSAIEMSLSSDGRFLAIAKEDGTVDLWDWQTKQGRQLPASPQEPDTSRIVDLHFSVDNQLLIIAKAKGEIHRWNVENPDNLWEQLPLLKSSEVVGGSGTFTRRALSISQDGRWMATGGFEVTVYNQNGEPIILPLPKASDAVDQVYPFLSTAFNLDGSLLAVGDINGQIYFQDLNEFQSGQNKPEGPFDSGIDRILSLSFNPEGDILAVAGTRGSKGVIRLWDVRKEEWIGAEIKGHQDWIEQVIFSPDGRRLATAGADGTARVWDLSGQELAQFDGFNEVVSLAFSADGKQLIAAGLTGATEDDLFGNLGLVQQWQIEDLEQLLARSCDWVRDYLTTLDDNNSDRHLCDGINPPEIDQPQEQGNISNGDKILVSSLANPEKQAGVEAIATADFPSAVAHLDTYLQTNFNDPEARIYLNNARIGEQRSYTIAVSVPISSNVLSDANGALEILRGVAQAQELHNKQIRETGSNEPLLKVLIADDRNDPEVAKAIAQQFANHPDVLGVVGHFSSNVTRAAAEIYNKEELLAISPVSTSVDLSDVLGKYVFRTVPNDAVAAESLANYMILSNKIRAAVFYNSQSEYSTSLKNAFQSTIKAQKGQITEFIDFSDPNFVAEQAVERIIQESAEVLVLLPNTEVLDKALEVVKVNDRRLPLLAGDDVYGTTILDRGREQACGLVTAIPWHILANTRTDFSYVSSKLWQADVNWRSAMAYDATKALIAAVQQAPNGKLTRRSMSRTLQKPDFMADGASDTIQFSRGDRAQNNIQLVEIQPGVRSGYGYDFVPVPIDSLHTSNCTRF